MHNRGSHETACEFTTQVVNRPSLSWVVSVLVILLRKKYRILEEKRERERERVCARARARVSACVSTSILYACVHEPYETELPADATGRS